MTCSIWYTTAGNDGYDGYDGVGGVGGVGGVHGNTKMFPRM